MEPAAFTGILGLRDSFLCWRQTGKEPPPSPPAASPFRVNLGALRKRMSGVTQAGRFSGCAPEGWGQCWRKGPRGGAAVHEERMRKGLIQVGEKQVKKRPAGGTVAERLKFQFLRERGFKAHRYEGCLPPSLARKYFFCRITALTGFKCRQAP